MSRHQLRCLMVEVKSIKSVEMGATLLGEFQEEAKIAQIFSDKEKDT